ncbi:hypothetical protein V9T40_006093 [Parthenolecanium corni]|uniref:Polypeptide N-acetylgalactosaminyltransferase n=1 Tax=Parthenolecanium corni TaxID=536013 RepID=A0AAN9YBA4_9HEMI
MKVCSLKRFLKYTLLISLTSFITTLVYHYVRHGHNDQGYSKSSQNEHLLENYNRVARSAKIDWHDYELIKEDKKRKGNGEQGIKATLPPDYDKKKYDALYQVNGFNALLSDFISVNRSIPDIRNADCKNIKYSGILPDVSVIVPFHDEHWSTLLRTTYSVLNRSPAKLIREIILVDDGSTKAHCSKPLDDYVAKNLPKVKVIHLKNRQGLIRARLAGAREARAAVLVFLDSHTEANVNWLPPLLEPIQKDYRTCVCPFIDVIDFETFAYCAQDEGARGAFDWEFFYKRLPLLPGDLKSPAKPFKSPVMAGGLFAISKKFFWELGGYDPGLDIWGGEQYELSFKIWQCGGTMLDAPCSRVGHIYRKFPPFPNPGIGDFVGKNYRRVAEVWMDEYAEYLYKRRPHYRKIDTGDLSPQREIRKKLNCKPFKWFMEEVAFDLVKKYPPIEPPDYGFGQIKPYINDSSCLTAVKNTKTTVLRNCSNKSNVKSLQDFLLSWHKDIKVKSTDLCLDVSARGLHAAVGLYHCHNDQGNQLWRYNKTSKQLIFGHNNQRCLDHDPTTFKVFVSECDDASETQMWKVEHIDDAALAKWDETEPEVD